MNICQTGNQKYILCFFFSPLPRGGLIFPLDTATAPVDTDIVPALLTLLRQLVLAHRSILCVKDHADTADGGSQDGQTRTARCHGTEGSATASSNIRSDGIHLFLCVVVFGSF